jgi:hypothetical protein
LGQGLHRSSVPGGGLPGRRGASGDSDRDVTRTDSDAAVTVGPLRRASHGGQGGAPGPGPVPGLDGDDGAVNL